jgi:hypothetical protein
MCLWSIFEDDKEVAAYVTEIMTATRGKALNVVALGGEVGSMPKWIDVFDEAVTKYGRDNGCHLLFEMGRDGWRRVLDRHGWVDGPSTMMKVL